MGTGTNVQKRLGALHELDAPWRPDEVEQREGRILRQGNENDEVAIYRYVTTGSFDSYMWQALETKARFISQIMSGEAAVRQAEDIGGQELSYAEVKAIASGNPAVLTLAEADAELQRLAVLKRNHADEQFLARRALKELPGRIERMGQHLASLSADQATMQAHASEPVMVAGRTDAVAALGERLEAMPEHVTQARRIPLGVYRGLRFGLALHPQHRPEVYLEGAMTCQDSLAREHQGPRAVLNAVERLAADYAFECRRTRQDLDIAQSQLRDFQARHGQTFAHEAYQAKLTTLRDLLKAALSGTEQQEGAASAAEIAGQIKALRTENTVEVAPQRTGKRRASAEEPVTARILRRAEAGSAASTKEEGGAEGWQRRMAALKPAREVG
jgi:hypothetical protein